MNDSETISIHWAGETVLFHNPKVSGRILDVLVNTKTFYESIMLKDIQTRSEVDGSWVDVGANIGNHSLFFAKICKKKVYAFEPHKGEFRMLRANVKLNNLQQNVACINLGLGKKNQFAEIIENYQVPGNHKLQLMDTETGTSVSVTTLDDFNFNERISLIKIDVEGMELDVLEGAQGVINSFHPILYLEITEQKEFVQIFKFLKSRGYACIDVFNYTPTYLFLPLS